MGGSPVFGNAAADAALLGFGYFAFTHVTPPSVFIDRLIAARHRLSRRAQLL